MTDLTVHLYALVWNEMPILPYFFEHYRPFVDQFYLADDVSDDGSFEYLSEQPDVVLRKFQGGGESFVEHARQFYCGAWKASRGRADYVIVVNIDELVHHADPRVALRQAREDGVTVIDTRGWQMIGDGFPACGSLPRGIPYGVRNRAMSKPAIFNPDAVTEINYAPGRHTARPQGRIVRTQRPLFDLLHYKHIGADYLIERYRQLAPRMREGDLRAGFGIRYSRAEEELRAEHERLRAAAAPVLLSDMKSAGLLEEPLPGVFVRMLRNVFNEKGGLREVWRDDDPASVTVRQSYLTTTQPGVVKAWYKHRRQTDQITPVSGAGRLVLWDTRVDENSAPVVIDMDANDPVLITVPPGIWHGFQAMSDVPLVLSHLNDQAFDHVRTDEIRLPEDDPSIPYRWPTRA